MRFLRSLLISAICCLASAPAFAQVTVRNGMSYVGTYSSGSTYAKGDVVSSNASLYLSLIAGNHGNALTNAADWQAMGSGNPETCSTNTTTSVCMGVSPYVAISGDYSVAFRQALTDLCASGAAGGDIFLPDGTYPLAGALQDTSGANAIVSVPKIANYTTQLCKISIEGFHDVNNGTLNGAIITTTATTGNVFGGYDSASGGGYPPFTNVELSFINVTLEAPTNPGVVFVNGTYLQAVTFDNVLCRTVSPTLPSNSAGGCVYMPSILNSYQNYIRNTTIAGFYTNAILTEHTSFDGIYSENSVRGVVFDNGFNSTAPGTYHGNSIHGGYLWATGSTCAISAGLNDTVVAIANFDTELNTHDVCDNAGSKIHLSGGWLNPYNSSTATLNVTGGGAHINMCDLWSPESCYSGGGGGSSTPLSSGLLEEWPAHEGTGTTIANYGTDGANSLAATNVTWTTATGFSGNQPTYNGTNSIATAASATQTAFTGTTPFSVCAWVYPPSFSYSGSEALAVSNLHTPLGWGLGFLATSTGEPGNLSFLLFSSGSNYISVNSTTGLTAGESSLACAVYSGSGFASGVVLYANGTSLGLHVNTDTFTTSAAATLPVSVGQNGTGGDSPYSGTIGKVEIWNRALSAGDISTLYANGPTRID